MKTRTYSDGTPTVTYTYDASGVANAKGRLTQVSSSVSVYDYAAYDALGRATRSTQTTDGQTYAMRYVYNRAGQMTSQTYPSGRTVTTSYDVAGRLSTATGNKTGETAKNYVSNFSYTAHGAVGARQLGNGLWEHTFFNTRLQPIEIGLGATSTASDKLKLEYGYGTTNNNGNVQSQTITAPGLTFTQTYTYDQLNRLHMAQENTEVWKQTYSYDQYGNRRIDAANTTANVLPQWNPTVDAASNRFSSAGYSYDLAGNLITDPAGHTYAYDGENRQKSYDNGQASYSYDGDGRRVKKYFNNVTTIFVYNVSGQLVAEYTINGVVETNGTRYVTSDTLGSPRIIMDKEGVVKARHDYLPFGEELWVNRTSQHGYVIDTVRQKFTGYERDNETGLDYAKARYYSSAQGRFTSPDEPFMDQWEDDPQSWNLYTYVGNNPLLYIDLFGLWKKRVENGVIFYESDSKYDTFESLAKELGVDARSLVNFYHQGERVALGQVFNVTNYLDYREEQDSVITTGHDTTFDGPPVELSGPKFTPKTVSVFKRELAPSTPLYPTMRLPSPSRIDPNIFSKGTSRNKPGSLGKFKGRDALRRENKVVRDVVKKLGLNKDQQRRLHDAISGEGLGYQEILKIAQEMFGKQ